MWMIIHSFHTEYPSAPVSFLAQSCRPSLPLLLLSNSCLHTSGLSFILVCWLWIIFYLLTFYARELICFDFVSLAQKILCNLGNNLSFSAWLQVTPELCSSFCDAFTLLLSSPPLLLHPVPQWHLPPYSVPPYSLSTYSVLSEYAKCFTRIDTCSPHHKSVM